VHAPGRLDPKAGPEARPTAGFSEQADQAAQIAVRERGFGGDESLPGVVIHVESVSPDGVV
jgi:hypothetical protein